jgi:hypothetical protein
MDTDDALRQSVIASLPELNEILDQELRGKVIDAWAFSLGKSSFSAIEEIPASGNPDTAPLKLGTQTGKLVEVQAKLVYTGRTSMRVRAADPREEESGKTTHCIITHGLRRAIEEEMALARIRDLPSSQRIDTPQALRPMVTG